MDKEVLKVLNHLTDAVNSIANQLDSLPTTPAGYGQCDYDTMNGIYSSIKEANILLFEIEKREEI